MLCHFLFIYLHKTLRTMRIPYTKILDKNTAECVVFFNDNERVWFYVKERKDTYLGDFLDETSEKFSKTPYANFSDIETWANSVEYYSITNEAYIFLKNAIEKVSNDIDNRRKYLDRIRNSFVEL